MQVCAGTFWKVSFRLMNRNLFDVDAIERERENGSCYFRHSARETTFRKYSDACSNNISI